MKPVLHAVENAPSESREGSGGQDFATGGQTRSLRSLAPLRWLFGVGFLGLMLFSMGCGSKSASKDGKDATTPLSAERCQQKLGSALEMLNAERIPTAAEFEVAVSMLNEWKVDCGDKQPTAASPAAAITEFEQDAVAFAAIKKLLTDAELEIVRAPRFDLADGRHVRDSRAFREIANQIVQKRRNDLDRAVDLFYYTMRNVSLQGASEQILPMNSYRIIIFGRGTVADRAWIFTSLLRQLRIDSAILVPQGKEDHLLVAVFIEEQIFLFDPRLGLPIPSVEERTMSPLPRQPATLAEALASDVVFRQLDAEGSPFPLSSTDLKNLRVQCVGDPSFWSPRMKELQAALTGERSLVVYDPLGDTSIGQGVLSRLADYGKKYWKKSEIGIWSHPRDSEKGLAAMNDAQKRDMGAREAAMSAPHMVTLDKQTKKPIPVALREQHRNRISQLMGRQADAIKQFVQVRFKIVSEISPDEPLTPLARQANLRAIADAALWTGAAQIEQEDYRAAAETLRQLIVQAGGESTSASHARQLLAVATASDDKFALASEILRGGSNPPVDPHFSQFLLKRWRTIRTQQEEMERGGKPAAPVTPATPPVPMKTVAPSPTPAPQKTAEPAKTLASPAAKTPVPAAAPPAAKSGEQKSPAPVPTGKTKK